MVFRHRIKRFIIIHRRRVVFIHATCIPTLENQSSISEMVCRHAKSSNYHMGRGTFRANLSLKWFIVTYEMAYLHFRNGLSPYPGVVYLHIRTVYQQTKTGISAYKQLLIHMKVLVFLIKIQIIQVQISFKTTVELWQDVWI